MRDDYLEDYYSFLRFPSVSTDEKFAGKVKECADWLSKKLTTIGLESKVVPTKGHPVVWARNKHKSGRPTVLIRALRCAAAGPARVVGLTAVRAGIEKRLRFCARRDG